MERRRNEEERGKCRQKEKNYKTEWGRRENREKELRTGDSLLIINNLDKQLHLLSVGIGRDRTRTRHIQSFAFAFVLFFDTVNLPLPILQLIDKRARGTFIRFVGRARVKCSVRMAIPETNRTGIYSKVETTVSCNTTPSRHNRNQKTKDTKMRMKREWRIMKNKLRFVNETKGETFESKRQ